MAQAQDPVCGAVVESGRSKAHSERYQNTSYYFCSDECRRKFTQNPEDYVPPSA
jgi:Cu+-exporting ATPase